MNNLLKKTALSAAIALTIAACSSSGGGVAGIGGSGFISSGSITGFGSVFVNGVEFETDSAIFDVDGDSGTQANLAIGMVVRVSGTINDDGITGTATGISFDDEIQGPVSGLIDLNPNIENPTRTFSVLGTNVVIDSSSTTFDVSGDVTPAPAFDFNNISNDNNIEVSGFFNSNGDIQATRIELKDILFDANSIVEVRGTISALSNTTFTLGGLTVNASSAELDDLPNGLTNGQLVEVKGTYNTTTKILSATKVEAENDIPDDTDEFEIEGLITNYDSISKTFTINGINVDASSTTLELEPLSLTLANDLRVEVEGTIVNGILVAEEIGLEDGNIEVHAKVTAVPPATAPNTFEVSPIPGKSIIITVSTGTQFESDKDENEFFNIDNLIVDDFVEVEGFDNGTGGVSATEVDVNDEISEVIVEGFATTVTGDASGGTMTVLGVDFIFDGGTTEFEIDSDIEGQDDTPMNSTQIQDLINAIDVEPQLVKIKDEKFRDGNPIGTADEIEIE